MPTLLEYFFYLLYVHYRKNHPGSVIESTHDVILDIDKDNEEFYLTSTSGFTFLFRMRINVATEDFYHAVHYVGDEQLVNIFDYQVEFFSSDGNICKKGKVLPFVEAGNKSHSTRALKSLKYILGENREVIFNFR